MPTYYVGIVGGWGEDFADLDGITLGDAPNNLPALDPKISTGT